MKEIRYIKHEGSDYLSLTEIIDTINDLIDNMDALEKRVKQLEADTGGDT